MIITSCQSVGNKCKSTLSPLFFCLISILSRNKHKGLILTYRNADPRLIETESIWREERFVVLGEDLKNSSLWPNVYCGRGSKKRLSIYLQKPNDGSKYLGHHL